jgi:molybdopterin/thiamine biosynthesis adenylyltransferase
MDLSDDQLDRYARHIILPEIGGAGQATLLASHILVIGAGGIGCPALAYLAAAGVGQITLIDDDVVSLSNLQRQILFGSEDIGKPKVDAAQKALQQINPDSKVIAIKQRFTAQHFSEDQAANFDCIIDGCDNFATRLASNRFSLAYHIPLVSAAVGPFEGQIATYAGWRADAPCYQCLVGAAPDEAAANCSAQGVLGALTGIIGSMAAMEAIRVLVPFGADRSGRLSLFDARDMRWRDMKLPKDPGCAACGSGM